MREPAPTRKTNPEIRSVRPIQLAGIHGVNRRRERTPVTGRIVNIRISVLFSNQEIHGLDSPSVISSSFHWMFYGLSLFSKNKVGLD
jgi:hypothetical protein